MSHFTVLIIGENVEDQLEPFWELDLSQKEAEEDPRAVFNDITEEEVKRFKAYINYCGITSFSIEKIVGEPIIDIEESVFETLIEKPMENIHTQVSSIELDPSKKEDSEIKIEELSLKSKSTLESFMNIELEKGK